MKSITKYEIKKLSLLLLFVTVLIVLIYKFAICYSYNATHNDKWKTEYNSALAYVNENGLTQGKAYLTNRIDDFDLDAVQINATSIALLQINNRLYYQYVKDVALSGLEYSHNLPFDFNKHKQFYAEYPLPEVVNTEGIALFKTLNEINFIPIIFIIVFSSFFSIEFESGMHNLIKIMKTGVKTIIKIKIFICLLCCTVIYCVLFIFDFLVSLRLIDASVYKHSFRSFIPQTLTQDSIFLFFLKIFILGFLHAVFFSCLVLLVSYLTQNIRLSYAVNGVIFLSFLILEAVVKDTGFITVLITGSLMNLYNETSLLHVTDSIIFSAYDVVIIFYIVAALFCIGIIIKCEQSYSKSDRRKRI